MDAMDQHQRAGEINGDEEEMEVHVVTEREDEVCGWMRDRLKDGQNYFIYIGMLHPYQRQKCKPSVTVGIVSSTFHAHRKGGPDLTDILLQ